MDDWYERAADTVSFINQMGEATANLASAATVPIIARPEGGPPHQHGTGTLFQVGGRRILVTAAHALDAGVRDGLELSTLDLTRPAIEVPLCGTIHQIADPHDVGVMDLDEETAASMPNRRFLSLAYADTGPARPGWFWVFGFPTSMAGPIAGVDSYNIEPWGLGGPIYTGATDGFLNYDSALHFLMHRDREALVNRRGEPGADLDPPIGISGCSIWRSCVSPINKSAWTPDAIKTVAVETSVYKRAVKGTVWRVVADLLWQTYPDIRPNLRICGCAPT